MRDKTAIDAMTPLESVYMLDINDRLDTEAMNEVGVAFVIDLVLI